MRAITEIKWRLVACRLQAGLTQKEVAEAIGVTDIAVGNWEKGKNSPSMEKGLALSELYGIPLGNMDFTKEGNRQGAGE